MGPHHHLVKSASKSHQSRFFPHHENLVLVLLLVFLTSCEAITPSITTGLRSVGDISSGINTNANTNNTTSINGSTSQVHDHYDNTNKVQATTTLAVDLAPIKSGTRIQGQGSAGWFGAQYQSNYLPNNAKNATKSEMYTVDGDLEGAESKDSGSEARGYYTFGDFNTTPDLWTQPSSSGCVCVPYYLCDEGQISKVIDIRHKWGCNSVLEVCCRHPRPTPAPTLPPWPTPSPTNPPITVQPGYNPQCGNLNPNGVNARILGFTDSETQYGEYPWMAAVLESKFVRGKWVLKFLCGASLITPRVLLTAAHCVKGKRVASLIIRLGEWDTQTTNEFYPYQDIQVEGTVIHPQFYSGGLFNDIAVIFLRTSAVLAPNVDTICLPYPNYESQYDPTSCFATGWGKSAFGSAGQYQAILREVELTITPNAACQAALRQTNLGSKFVLNPGFICAGGQKGQDTCIGDGGGPLVCPSSSDPWRYVLVGITSWGIKCGTYGIPGVYVNVPRYRQWIDSVIQRRFPGFNPTRWTLPPPTQDV